MLAIHTILHPTDFSEQAQYALGLACALTRDYGARLVVLHVVPRPVIVGSEGMVPPNPEELRAGARRQLDGLEVPHGNVRAERRLEEGDAPEGILRVARDIHADLIVM